MTCSKCVRETHYLGVWVGARGGPHYPNRVHGPILLGGVELIE
jgi:hypothetical protein